MPFNPDSVFTVDSNKYELTEVHSERDTMGNVILTGVDASQTALVAARKAAKIAAGTGEELHVITAYSTATSDSLQSMMVRDRSASAAAAYETLMSSREQAAQLIADAVAGVLTEEYPDLTVVSSAVGGPPAAALLRKANELNADTIVVGNKNIKGIGRVLGSIARKLVADAPCDVHIVNTAQQQA